MQPQIIILDGGMGRELLRIGAPFRQPEWSALALMEAPHYVRDVHQAFIEAGADVITTNSYALVPFHIGEDRFAADAERLAALAGAIGREAIAASSRSGLRLAGSLPPLFGSYRPDLFRPEDAPRILAPLVRGLAPHVDLWLAETLSSTQEAVAAATAVQAASPRPLWLSFTLDDSDPKAVAAGVKPATLRSGESIAAAVQTARRVQAETVLFNCSDPAVMAPAVRAAAAAWSDDPQAPLIALGVYANAFVPEARAEAANEGFSRLRTDLPADAYLAYAQDWQTLGVSIIGGCCGIGPETIAALSAALRPHA